MKTSAFSTNAQSSQLFLMVSFYLSVVPEATHETETRELLGGTTENGVSRQRVIDLPSRQTMIFLPILFDCLGLPGKLKNCMKKCSSDLTCCVIVVGFNMITVAPVVFQVLGCQRSTFFTEV